MILCLLSAALAMYGNAHASETASYKYVGNNFSLKFHRPSCPFAMQIWPNRLEHFAWRRQAVERGYRPCKYCLPRVWTNVHAVLLTAPPETAPAKTKAAPTF